jgi:hypothetical protein
MLVSESRTGLAVIDGNDGPSPQVDPAALKPPSATVAGCRRRH